MQACFSTPYHTDGSGERCENTYELLHLRALKLSPVNKSYIFPCMGKILCLEFQRYFEISHKISYPYIESCDLYTTLKFQDVLNLRDYTCFRNAPQNLLGYLITSIFTLEIQYLTHGINTLRLRQNGSHLAHNTFKWIYFNKNIWIVNTISLKFVPMSPINNKSSLVQVMTWRLTGNKPLSEPTVLYWCMCIT